MEVDLTHIPAAVLMDLTLRAMILGQLLLLAVPLLKGFAGAFKYLLFACTVSVAALVMLTAPIPEATFGLLRNILLVLTDAFAILFWFLIHYAFDDEFKPERWSRTVKSLLLILVLPYLYVLGVQAGASPLHSVIHIVGMVLLLHTVYIAVRDFRDDLLDNRRRARILIVVSISVYSLVLVAFELVDERFRNATWFGLINNSLLLITITVTAGLLFRISSSPVMGTVDRSARQVAEARKFSDADSAVERPRLSNAETALQQALDEFVAQKRYRQNALTIAEMARQLDCPVHHLRRLINNTLGNRNFNSFLNDLRIPDACAQLADPTQNDLPILSIALSLGYDSIGPFNRAFKAQTDLPPSEFRRNVQNQR